MDIVVVGVFSEYWFLLFISYILFSLLFVRSMGSVVFVHSCYIMLLSVYYVVGIVCI